MSGCASSALSDGGEAKAAVRREANSLVYVGEEGGKIQALRLDAKSGRLTVIGPVAELPRPRWGVTDPAHATLYVASDGQGQDGQVVAYAVQPDTGALTLKNALSVGGAGTTHLALDTASRTLLAANFSSGSAVSVALKPDGGVDALTSTMKSTGSGPHRRQTAPHAHGVVLDPSGHFALVPDLGADRVFIYAFDPATHRLGPDDGAAPRAFQVKPGSGPRRVLFGAGGRFAYVLDELTADVIVARWDPAAGTLSWTQTVPLSSPDFQGARSGAEMVMTRDGRFLLVADRGEHTVVVFRADSATGALSFVQRVPAGGDRPWNLAIDPSGRWVLVANQQSNTVRVFGFDPATGQLSDTGQAVASASPLSITFYP